jgi:hypothetical protein
MLLICASCRRRWTPKPGQKRTESCPRCRKFHLSSAQIRAWERRRLGARTEAVEEPGTYPADTLENLMREADLASAKALEAALSVSRKR